MYKKKIFLCAAITILTCGFSAIVLSNSEKPYFASQITNDPSIVWKHYDAIGPTKDSKGIKQYWIACGTNEVRFEKPDSENIFEGNWTEDKKSEIFNYQNDSRLIDEGDFLTFLESDNNFLGGKLSGLTFNAQTKEYSMIVGDTKYKSNTTLVAESDAKVHLNGEYLRIARACGYKYLSFSLKAESIMDNFKANHYAIATSGYDWKINFSETNIEDNNYYNYEIDLSLYDNLPPNDFFLYFAIRNQENPGINAVVSNVSIKDIEVTTYSLNKSFQTNKYTSIDEINNNSEVINNFKIKQEKLGSGGYYATTGISLDYLKDIKEAFGFEKIYLSLKFSNIKKYDDKNDILACFVYKKDTEYKTIPSSGYLYLIVDLEETINNNKNIFIGVATSGGGSQPAVDIDVNIFYSELQTNYYINGSGNPDNVSHKIGLNASLFKLSNPSGGGGVGNTEKTNGASVTVNGQERDLMFFGDYLNIYNYDPSESDIVIYKAGTYSDPTNGWGVNRVLTLDKDLAFEYKNGRFFKR